ncbi:MAG: PAS domain-containing sensor histidine kinase, partial [Cytophagales bacterium]|nr:PAS domain-containing sensor histidine kinase [Cytophagales bacterium]
VTRVKMCWGYRITMQLRQNEKHIYFTGRDITEKKHNLFALEENAQMISQILDLVPHAIFIKNSKRKYILVNSAQTKLYGKSKDSLLGIDDSKLHNHDDELRQIWDTDSLVLEHKESVLIENQIVTLRDGTQKYLSTQKIPFISSIDGSVNILGVSVDITDFKRASQDLMQANFELDTFVYRASHDLRAPLRSILGLINVAFLKPDIENIMHCLQMIRENVSKLDSFITDLTEYSRNNRISIEIVPIDFNSLVNEAFGNLKYMEGAEKFKIELETKKLVGVFESDFKRLMVIFSNLLSNSIKYSKKTESDFLKIEVSGNSSKSVSIKFTDNGIGIDNGHLDRIFDMFYRASEHSFGSGLGLYIVKQIVEKLHGSITVSSEIGKGTSFIIILPNLNNKSH